MTKTGVEERKATTFVVKDIVKKKKNPQQKLEKYFPVTKARAARGERNFQGFPIEQCRFEEKVGKLVYCPPCYNNLEEEKESSEERELCSDCLLRPCIVEGKGNELFTFCEDIMIFGQDDSEVMYTKMLKHADDLMGSVFGERYTRNHPATPECILEVVMKYHTLKTGMEVEENQGELPDDELVANAVDGSDFLPYH